MHILSLCHHQFRIRLLRQCELSAPTCVLRLRTQLLLQRSVCLLQLCYPRSLPGVVVLERLHLVAHGTRGRGPYLSQRRRVCVLLLQLPLHPSIRRLQLYDLFRHGRAHSRVLLLQLLHLATHR